MAYCPFDAVAGELAESLEKPCKLSVFRSLADPAPQTITLAEFLDMVRDGDAKTAIIRLRSEPDEDKQKALKRMLPAVTVSGAFSGGHQMAHMVEHSGLICMDFDLDRNPALAGCPEEWRDKLAGDEFVRAAFLSARGNGVAAICRIDAERHAEAFDALVQYFKGTYSLLADAQCRDPSRLRFLSWDTDARENTHARVFRRFSLSSLPSQQEDTGGQQESISAGPAPEPVSLAPLTASRREELLSALERLSPNNRDVWMQVGMAIQSEAPGLDGFNLWERWSQLADSANKWNEKDARRVWQSFGRRAGTNVETLFALAYKAGWKGAPTVTLSGALPTVQASVWFEEAEAPLDPVLDGVFDTGEFCEVIAPSKCRKSFFVLQLALCLASGRKFLKWTMPKARKVLLVNFEITAKQQHRRGRRMRSALGIQPQESENLIVANVRGLELPDPVSAVMATIREHKPALVILDPLYMLHNGDENTAVDMVPLIRRLSAIMAETGAAIIIVHHDAKGKAGDRDIRDRGSGSSVFSRYCDARLTLTPHAESDDLVCVDMMARNHPPQDGFVCRMDGAFSMDEQTAYEPATSKNVRLKIKSKAVVADAVEAAIINILKAGPFAGSAVENMIKDSGVSSQNPKAAAKRAIKEDPRIYVMPSINGRKEQFGSASDASAWQRIGVNLAETISNHPPLTSDGKPLLKNPVDPLSIPLTKSLPPLGGGLEGTGVGVSRDDEIDYD